jgi:hypothetical protein
MRNILKMAVLKNTDYLKTIQEINMKIVFIDQEILRLRHTISLEEDENNLLKILKLKKEKLIEERGTLIIKL